MLKQARGLSLVCDHFLLMPRIQSWMTYERFLGWRLEAFPEESLDFAIDTWVFIFVNCSKEEKRTREIPAGIHLGRPRPYRNFYELLITVKCDREIIPIPVKYQ